MVCVAAKDWVERFRFTGESVVVYFLRCKFVVTE